MLFFKTEVRDSPIEGKGLFSLEKIVRGQVVGDLTYRTEILTEEQYQQAQRNGDKYTIQCAVRLINGYFITPQKEERNQEKISFKNEDYINHSENPNLLYHCGFLFALRDIKAGEELTVNYRYFLAVDDVESFKDVNSGKFITGFTDEEALLNSAQELVALLKR